MASKRGLVAREDESLAAIGSRSQSRGLTEIWVVWALFGLATAAVFETYWRIPPSELWKVHNSGFVGGAGRALVFVGDSPAIAAFAVLPIVADRLEDRRAHIVAGVALREDVEGEAFGTITPIDLLGELEDQFSHAFIFALSEDVGHHARTRVCFGFPTLLSL